MFKFALVLMFTFLVGYDAAKSRSLGQKPKQNKTKPSGENNAGKPSQSSDMIGEKILGTDDARHFLARTHFSVDQTDLKQVAKMTRNQAVNWLFNQQNFAPLPAQPRWMKGYNHLLKVISKGKDQDEEDGRNLTTRDLDMVLGELKDVQDSAFSKQVKRLYKQIEEPDSRKNMRHLRNLLFKDLQNWWFEQMLNTEAPIVERMTLFLHGHFTTGFNKVKDLSSLIQQNQLFRKHALGSFKTLLTEVSKGPAMLRYLDGNKNRKNKPNENFAREVMELYTLGEGNGYTEQDIKEAARAFTGWSIKDNKFFFNDKVHDTGQKTIFGKTDKWNGKHVLDMLTEKKQTARFVSKKVWQFFVGNHHGIPNDLHKKLTDKFYDSGYQFKQLLREILISDSFFDSRGKLIKSPIDLAVGAVLDLDLEADYYYSLVQESTVLGQSLFNPPNVKGWPGGEYWINAASYLARKSFLTRLIRVNEKKKNKPNRGKAKSKKANNNKASENDMDAMTKSKDKVSQNYKFDNELWLSQFRSDAEAIYKMLPLQHYNPLQGVEKEQWAKELLMDPTYQLR